MSIHILYEFRDGPWGGGNQFLKALRDVFRQMGIYAEQPEKASRVLFNSHHFGPGNIYIDKLVELRCNNPDIAFIQRIDGPIEVIRGTDRQVDSLIFRANTLLADGTIFQTEWSRELNLQSGLKPRGGEVVINNAPDPDIFHLTDNGADTDKIRLIATSWAANPRKGFAYYDYLDRHLDWSRFQMVFVGNTPQPFNNIKHIPPQDSCGVAELLRENDIYITGSMNDPCSNSLLEALHSGLPAVALDSGGHPELIGKGGALFTGEQDLIAAIEKIAGALDVYRARISVRSLEEIAGDYADFIMSCSQHPKSWKKKGGWQMVSTELKARIRWASLKSRISGKLNRLAGKTG